MRDNQRARLYKAESYVDPDFKTLAECYGFIKEIESSRWYRARWRSINPVLNPGQGCRSARASVWTNTITLPLWARSKLVICHEFAHLLTASANDDRAAHGPEFAGVYLALVDRFVSPEASQQLRQAFKTNRVRVNNRGIPSPTRKVVTQAEAAAKKAPTIAPNLAAMAIRQRVKAGDFGPSGSKPRTHALATARTLEGLT